MHDPLRLISALQDPGLYGSHCQAIRLLETHISWVILTGEFAYKIKKPVDFGFLDFSNLSQRRFFCQEELRLNRRLAAPLYLGVVPITGSVDSPQLGGTGPALEYAVKLRQFDEDNLGDRLAREGRLDATLVDDLALLLARFHQAAPGSVETDSHGLPDSIQAAAEHNFFHLAPPEDTASRRRLEDLMNWTRASFQSLRQTMLARKREGYVRECHGDLHLGNLVLIDGHLMPFDCIEFSEDLRWIDVMSELAFIVMDLEVTGCAALAFRLTNRYLEITGDYAGLELLNYYRVYRAMVRAKIASLSLSQCQGHAEDRAELARRLNEYLDYADRAIQPRRPILAITHGFSGSGKSYLAGQIAEGLPAIRLGSDIERKRMAGLSADARTAAAPLDGIYSLDFTQRTYEHLLSTARQMLNAGFNVVVDATFLIAAHRNAQRQMAEECGARFLILDVQAPETILRQRVESRMRAGADPSEADVAVLQRQIAYAEPLNQGERALALNLNSAELPDFPAIIAALKSAVSPR